MLALCAEGQTIECVVVFNQDGIQVAQELTCLQPPGSGSEFYVQVRACFIASLSMDVKVS